MNLAGIGLVAVVVAGGMVVIAVAFWAAMLLVRSSVEVACRVTMLLVRYSLRRARWPRDGWPPDTDTDLAANAALREQVDSGALPLRIPVLSGARPGQP